MLKGAMGALLCMRKSSRSALGHKDSKGSRSTSRGYRRHKTKATRYTRPGCGQRTPTACTASRGWPSAGALQASS